MRAAYLHASLGAKQRGLHSMMNLSTRLPDFSYQHGSSYGHPNFARLPGDLMTITSTSTNQIQLGADHAVPSTATLPIPAGRNSRWSLIQSEQQSEVDAELITVSRSDKGTNFYHYPRQGATRKDQDVCQTCKNYHSKRAMSRARFPLLASTPT